jgi:AcrR family transcriptional regulator/DNA-binding MarR family transcriptional regulator
MAGGTRTPSHARGQAAPGEIAHDHNGATMRELPSANAKEGALAARAISTRMIEIQRARILAAMVEVCAERGAGNVTVAHIVERAGVSRRTFYELYRDREACFLGAFDDGIARVSRNVLDAYDPDARWVERVRLALTSLLAFLDAERGVGQILIVGSLGAGQDAMRRRGYRIAQMIALVDEGRQEDKVGSELPPLAAEGIVGGVLSVLHSRLLESDSESLLGLTGPLMSMIVLPYLGPAVARRELRRPAPAPSSGQRKPLPADPLRDVPMRLTYRTVRVLTAIATLGGQGSHPSNRELGLAAGMSDQGQISKLLTRLSRLGLIENTPAGRARGAPNAWTLTPKGREIEQAIGDGAMG